MKLERTKKLKAVGRDPILLQQRLQVLGRGLRLFVIQKELRDGTFEAPF